MEASGNNKRIPLLPYPINLGSSKLMKNKSKNSDIFESVFIFHLVLIPLLFLATSTLGTFSVPILVPCLTHLLLVRYNEINFPLTSNKDAS